MSQSIEYLTCAESWNVGEDSLLTMLDESGRRLGSFPLEFLRTGSADSMNGAYLLRVCRALLVIPATCPFTISGEGGILDPADQVAAGTYIVNGSFDLRPGPSGKSRSRPFRDTDGASTVSKSSRSTANQSRFKMELLARDGECLLSGEDVVESLVACHIVPFSLGQLTLDEICAPLRIGQFSVTNGLLLSPSLHVNFDRYLWGIYTFEGSHFVHVFGENYHTMHGKQIQYRARKIARLPNKKLLDWHYNQCLMARVRGHLVKQF